MTMSFVPESSPEDGKLVRQLQKRRSSSAWAWVPIRSLGERHRERIAAHLLSLAPTDRYLRFGHAAGDEQIRRYVDHIDFVRDEVMGIFNRKLQLIAMAHLAYDRLAPPALPQRAPMAEFGVSVLDKARGRGYGARLFQHAVMHARNRGVDLLMIHALSENSAMLKIARQAGATIERDGSESQAWLKLPPETLASRLEQVVETQAAEADYRLKRHAIRWEHILDIVHEVRGQIAASGRVSQD